MAPARAVRFSAWRDYSLLARFGVISLLIVVALGAVVSTQLRSVISARAQANAEASAQVYLELVKQRFLDPAMFAGTPVSGAGPSQIALSEELLTGPTVSRQVLSAEAYLADGTVAFSTRTALIGSTQDLSATVQEAFTGSTVSRIAGPEAVHADGYDPADHPDEQVLVVDTPLSVIGDGAPEVVVELATRYTDTAAAVRHDVAVMLCWLAGGLLVLYVSLFRLVATASRRLRQQAVTNRDLALHDALTGLPNRTLLAHEAELAVERAARHGAHTALLLLDLDRFKEINDALGHHYGDLLLRQVGPRLESVLRERDTVARLGGDEFVVLLHDVTDEAAAQGVAAKLLAALDEPFVVEGVELDVGSSLGIALTPQHGEDFETLMRRADVAMYAAKAMQSGSAVYDPEQDVHTPAQLTLLADLRRAIDSDQLVLHYQPKVGMATRELAGVEALVRWAHPTQGLLGPDTFIPLAERTGLIRPLTLAVLDRAVRQAAAWQAAGTPLSVAVNISARCLLDLDLDAAVASALERHGVTGDLLELEITESTVMVDPDRALEVLRSLAALGIRLSIDDFGTGYSSLAYLKRLPVSELKIDRSFVMEMAVEANEVIVAASIELARRLGLTVVAEGVEDQATWDRLAALGCHTAQGYLLARPLPADELDAWVASHRTAGTTCG